MRRQKKRIRALGAQVANCAGQDAENECAPGVDESRGGGGSDESGDGTCGAPLGRLSPYPVVYRHSPEQNPTMLQLFIAKAVSRSTNQCIR